ncbi:MAG: glycosyltransferase family A protein [Phycisphaerae bacterium]|nr:glycosyltransferase family A protein [Phycisphaerae bacterium]
MITVIIPSYNSAQCISRAIDSVLSQSFSDYEIIVVDDGSTDNTSQAVERYGGKVRYIRQDNAGPAAARNAGIKAAKGEWIAFLDADDEWLADKLRRQMEILEKNPELKWCGSNFSLELDGNERPALNPAVIRKTLAGRDYFENYFRDSIKGHSPTAIITSTITLVIHKSVFEQTGLFDVSLMRQQDHDMWVRIACRFLQMGYIAEPLAIAHLGVADAVMTQRRLDVKRGLLYRQTTARHLELAAQCGCLDDFKVFASVLMRDVLLITLFHGLKADARETARQFPQLLTMRWRAAAYILTVFPNVTAKMMQMIAYFADRLKLVQTVSRRWVHLKAHEKR